MYVPKFTSYAVEDFKALPANVKRTLRREIEAVICKDPVGCSEALVDPLSDFRSRHIGDYRLVYRVFEDLKALAFVGASHKNASENVYERLGKLAATGQLADKVLSTLRMFGAPK